MAEIITMPRLSDTMTEGVVASWLKNIGDTIVEGDILAEIETDKATMEFESFHEGTLLYIGVKEGETAKVDALLAIIGKKDEDITALINNAPLSEKPEEKVEEEIQSEEPKKEESSSDIAIPEGVEVVTMPKLSDTMEEGTVAKWLKNIGDTIEEGEIIAEIETDKATMEFESFYNGTLLYIGVAEGDSAKVDSVLAIIGKKDTDIAQFVSALGNVVSKTEESKEVKKENTSQDQKQTTPVVEKKVVKPTIQRTSSDGRIIASPLAKKLAEEKSIDLQYVQGTGDGGRIIKRDIENYVAPAGGNVQAAFVPTGQESFEDITNSQMRKVIARRLGESKFTAPHYYLNVEFNMDNAIAFREQYNSIPDTKISFNDMVVKATALALKQHPQVNSQWFDDKMRLNHHVHIGVAVAVEDGLVVPVLKFANEQNLIQINAQVKDFAGRARDKKLALDEMEGSTFTISNLGMFGITDFTSIINQPNSAILSVGTIVQKPIVKEGNIVVGNTMKLTLACDHRTVDGVTGALFLQTLKGYIENPVTMLI